MMVQRAVVRVCIVCVRGFLRVGVWAHTRIRLGHVDRQNWLPLSPHLQLNFPLRVRPPPSDPLPSISTQAYPAYIAPGMPGYGTMAHAAAASAAAAAHGAAAGVCVCARAHAPEAAAHSPAAGAMLSSFDLHALPARQPL